MLHAGVAMASKEGRSNDDPRLTIKALAWYVHRGHPLEHPELEAERQDS